MGFLKQNALQHRTRDFDNSQAAEEMKVDSGPTCSVIPFIEVMYYEAAKTEGPQKKMLEFNTAL